jgi:hypothetical protein
MMGLDIVDYASAGRRALATAEFGGAPSHEGGVLGATESLYAFPGNGAQHAMAAMAELTRQCPTVGSTAASDPSGVASHFSVTAGPHLGEQSLVVKVVLTYRGHPGVVERADAVVVRVGSTLAVISSIPVYPGDDTQFASFMPAAVAQLTAAHPKPVRTGKS